MATANYYDLDVLIALDEKIKITFEKDIDWCGYLLSCAGSNAAVEGSQEENILKGSCSLVPLWLAKTLKESRNSSDLLSIVPPKSLDRDLLHVLRADPDGVNFCQVSKYFLLHCCWMSRLLWSSSGDQESGNKNGNHSERLFQALLSAFSSRTKKIFFQASQQKHQQSAFLLRLDVLERNLFRAVSLCQREK